MYWTPIWDAYMGRKGRFIFSPNYYIRVAFFITMNILSGILRNYFYGNYRLRQIDININIVYKMCARGISMTSSALQSALNGIFLRTVFPLFVNQKINILNILKSMSFRSQGRISICQNEIHKNKKKCYGEFWWISTILLWKSTSLGVKVKFCK